MNTVIITARRGRGKHLERVNGLPIVLYPILSAANSSADLASIWTDCPKMRSLATRNGVASFDRPKELCTDDSPHKDIIRHAVEHEEIGPNDNVIVLLGNTVNVTPALIDACFAILDRGDCDGVMTGWRAQDDHPMRAMTLKNGYVAAYGERGGSNRQGYPPVWFYDNGIWGTKGRCVGEMAGPPPWEWLGRKTRLVERPWVTGRDVHDGLDLAVSGFWLQIETLVGKHKVVYE